MPNRAIIIFQNGSEGPEKDLEVPLSITANDLIAALDEAFSLGITDEKIAESYLKAENPIVLVRGNRTLEQLGIHNGTKLLYER